MKYQSNFKEIADELTTKLKRIQNDSTGASPILREIALSIMTSSDRRIFNESKDVSGANITYKRPRKTPKKGAYSKAYAKVRSEAGRQTSKVDLFMSGVFHKTYQAQPIPGGWGIGFASKYGGDIYKATEKMYGKVFGETAKDKRAIKETMNREINKRLR
jgi:hypothetical protein|tara:strand:+ start:67 stop:546 length:480 start_codon:yes stop_codon:yes gene_type:complete